MSLSSIALAGPEPHEGQVARAMHHAFPAGAMEPDSPAGLDSAQLLCGRKAVEIRHNGLTYRLQTTRLGKLILTK